MAKPVQNDFHSILANELVSFLDYRNANGHDIRNERYILRRLDSYLVSINLSEKKLDAETLDAWINTSNVERNTKCIFICISRQLARYLCCLGIPACCPRTMKTKRNYTPYVLSHEEIQRVFEVCDNLEAKNLTHVTLWFPVMVRMLYGCGLRIGEAISLQNKDIDWNNNILRIRAAKGNKDRLVPMSNSLADICAAYYSIFHPAPAPDDYFFHNHKGQRLSEGTPYAWMRKVYELADIDRYPDVSQSRGICVHTLRHTFAVHTLQNQSDAGIDRFYSIPVLSTYMGHNDIYGTEMYLRLTPEFHESIVKKTESYVSTIFPEVFE